MILQIAPTAEALFQRAFSLHQQGHIPEAQALYREILKFHPRHFDSLHNLGVACAQRGQVDLAIKLITDAISLTPNPAEAYKNRGILEQHLHRLDDALHSFEEAIRHQPDYADAYFNRGNTLLELKRHQDALSSFDEAIRLNPNIAQAYSNRGHTLQLLRRHDEALKSFDEAILLKPDFDEAYSNRGTALLEFHRHEEALLSFNEAIRLNPDLAEAYFNRGYAFQLLNRHEEALKSYDEAIRLNPEYTMALLNRGNVLQELDRLEEAVNSYDKAIRIEPRFAEAHANRGYALQALGRYDEALNSFDEAIRLNPDYANAYGNKSLCLLLLGDFSQGWPLYEWRWKTDFFNSSRPSFEKPRWTGSETIDEKTILLYSEQGLGDSIQFCRYATLVASLGARVVLSVQPELTGLLDRLDGVGQIVATGQPLPMFDYQCSLLSLPLAFKTTLESIPCPEKYLSAVPDRICHFNNVLGAPNRPRVGLVWSGGSKAYQPTEVNVNKHRNIPFSLLARLKELDIEFVSLQKGEPAESELKSIRQEVWPEDNLVVLPDELTDFAATAALIENLDLVISVDTAVVHLAGALGKPVWLLNRYDSCWRWLLDREDSPWYPTMKIYRQPSMGDWISVIDRVLNDLTTWSIKREGPC